jgi:acyl-coenzyme A thioesterase PaaI-like protein
MALLPLRNETWGFGSNCFVCEPKNHSGLRIPFLHDDEREVVVAEFTLDNAFSGAPSFVHGGLSLAILDEAQAWATIAVAKKFAVTGETTSRFLRPVRLDKTYRVEARIEDRGDEKLRTSAVILDYKDRVCVESEATFIVLSEAVAADAIGAPLSEEESKYLR